MKIWIVLLVILSPINSIGSSIDLDTIQFFHLTQSNGLRNKYIESSIEDPYGFYWFGHRRGGGLTRWDGYKFKSFYVNDQNPTSLLSNDILYLYVDDYNQLWIATNQGVNRYDIEKDLFVNYNRINGSTEGLTSDFSEPIVQDLNGNLWIGGSFGLNKYDREVDTFSHYFVPPITDRPTNTFISLKPDTYDPNIIWCGTRTGLVKLNIAQKTFEKQVLSGYANFNLKGQAVFDIQVLSKDQLMLFGPGRTTMVFYDHNEPSVYQVKHNFNADRDLAGFSNATMSGYLSHKNNNIWFSSTVGNGLFSIDKPGFRIFKSGDGSDTRIIDHLVRYITQDRHGRLYFPGNDGVSISYDALENPKKKTRIKTYMSSLLVNGVEKVGNIHSNAQTNLLNHENNLQVTFLYPNPFDQNDVQYAYRLLPKDTDWIFTKEREVTFENLRGGSYQLEVKAKEGENEWTNLSTYPINIFTPYYKMGWFIMLVGFSFVGILLAFYFWRIRQIRQQIGMKAEYEKKLSELKMQALRSQMNPHFIYNSINSINWFIIKNDQDNASDYLTKFSRLMRLNLENSKLDLVSLANELESIRLYLEMEQLRFERKFEYQIKVESHINTSSIFIPPMIIQPFIENAIWHGIMHKVSDGVIQLGVSISKGNLICLIEDNGVGREAAQKINKKKKIKKKSLGMQITKDRLENIKAFYNFETKISIMDLYDELGNAMGTRIALTLPILNHKTKSQ